MKKEEILLKTAYILIWVVLCVMCFIGDSFWIALMLLWGNICLFLKSKNKL